MSGYDAQMAIVDDPAAATNQLDRLYEPVPVEEVLEKYGHWKPMFCRKPSGYMQTLLEGIPSPVLVENMQAKSSGLMYLMPPSAINPMKTRCRTSVPGLMLLKHLAEKNRKFRPFFDAYYSREAERRITLECMDLTLGILPTSFKRIIKRNEEIIQKHRETVYQSAQAWQKEQARSGGPQGGMYQLTGGQLSNQLGNQLTATEMQRQMEMQNARLKQAQAEEYAKLANRYGWEGLLGGPSSLLGTTKGMLGSMLGKGGS